MARRGKAPLDAKECVKLVKAGAKERLKDGVRLRLENATPL